MLTGRISAGKGGPIAIGRRPHPPRQLDDFVLFMALISVNLAVIVCLIGAGWRPVLFC
jgi:hypothetical protein